MSFFTRLILPLLSSIILISSCTSRPDSSPFDARFAAAVDSLVARQPGEIGIAVITSSADTFTLANDRHYPLMSVFKLHQAVAVTRTLHQARIPLDSTLTITRSSLNPHTWSPMLGRYPGDTDVTITYSQLLDDILINSDNNASNILFSHVVSVSRTDSMIRSIIPDTNFSIIHDENTMWLNHDAAYDNWSSPLACATLLDRVMTDTIVPPSSRSLIRNLLHECLTGSDRLCAPVASMPGVTCAHRTGSGYTDSLGRIVAFNDVAFITLPDHRHYTIALLIKDYAAHPDSAVHLMADISRLVYNTLNP